MGDLTILKTVRHGATEFNSGGRYAGLLDVPLNDEGRAEAVRASRLLDVSADVVISSTLDRAHETARLLSGGTRRIVTSALCVERDFGQMQGRTPDETETLRPMITYFRMGSDFHSLNPPGGETLPALRRRAARFADWVFTEFAGRTVLIVSHEVFLLQFHGLLRGETWREAMAHTLSNLTLTTLTLKGRRLLDEMSQTLPTARG